jgi:hypothetical protein
VSLQVFRSVYRVAAASIVIGIGYHYTANWPYYKKLFESKKQEADKEIASKLEESGKKS